MPSSSESTISLSELEALQSPSRDRKRKWWRLNRHVTGNGNGGASIATWPETEMVALQSPRYRKRKWWRFNRHVTGNGNGCASKSRDLGCFRFTSCSLFCSGLFPDFLIIYCWLYRDIFYCQSPDPSWQGKLYSVLSADFISCRLINIWSYIWHLIEVVIKNPINPTSKMGHHSMNFDITYLL